jgi:hypothetical protein
MDALRVRHEIRKWLEFLDYFGEVLNHLFECFLPICCLIFRNQEFLLWEGCKLGCCADKPGRLGVEDTIQMLELCDSTYKGIKDREYNWPENADLEVYPEGCTVNKSDLDDDMQCWLPDIWSCIKTEVL